MWPNLQEIAHLVTFTEEILMKNLIFCAVLDTECQIKFLKHQDIVR